MSVVLYKPGNTHVVDDIECEVGIFEPKDLNNLLQNGWVTNVKDLKEEEKKENENEEEISSKNVRKLFNKNKKVKK
jgi:hypothetical protein